MNAEPNLEAIRTKLAALEGRMAGHRERFAAVEAMLGDEPTPKSEAPSTEPAPAKASKSTDAGAGWKTSHGRNWLSEAMEDLDAVEVAAKSKTRRIRPATAPEYASQVAAEEEAEKNAADPDSADGGNRTESTASADAGNADGAAAGNPEGSKAATQPAKRPAPAKKPQAVASADWRERCRQIEAAMLVARLSPARGDLVMPFDGLPLRAGAGPPGR